MLIDRSYLTAPHRKRLSKSMLYLIRSHKLNKTNWFLGIPNSFTGINPNWGLKWRRRVFLEGLIDKLPLYFSDPEKIKQVIHFVVKYFHESLTSKHVIKIIKSLHNDSVSYIVANFIHFLFQLSCLP